MGDGVAEGSSAAGDGGQAAVSLMPDIAAQVLVPGWNPDAVRIFENSQLEGLYVGDLLYSTHWGFYTHGDIKGAFIHSFTHSVPTGYRPWLAGKLCPPRAFGPEGR